jgi:hypothetical protein
MADNDRETVVVTDSGGGGAGLIIAIVLVVALIVGGFLLYRSGAFGGAGTTIEVPDKIDVNVNPAK